jgi:hypothetical protein
MLAAERDGKPRDVILAANVIGFYPFSAATDCALANSFSFAHEGLAILR